ncbi:DEAD/DEAH box helicase, partial [candidate division KSB1 bacterium]|nr:DEAD/DEAH box helicase [candidate division KSB1 bacterium]
MLPSVLARQLEQGLKDYIETTFPVSTPMFQDTLKDLLDRPQGLFKGPYISIKLPFRPGSVGENAFKDIPFKYDPYLHQERAFERLGGEETKSTIIATGTGSGKTECFLFPILDYCYRHHTENGIKAIIIYPMNALATDQAKRLAHTIYHTPALKNNVTAGLYIGQHEKHPSPEMGPEKLITDKNIMHQTPPDILLTNYKMLDLLLIRPHAYGLWRNNGPETLKFIVVDELHTFDGAQGTDLACLLRRLKHRLATPKKHICCVGTSATLGGKDDMAQLTEYASSVFSEDFEPDSVITEELLTAEEFCSGDRDIDYHLPNVAALNGLESLEDPQEYKYSIVKAWYGSRLQITGEDEEPFELGWLLKHHAFLKALLQTIGNRAVSVDDILAGLDLSYPDFKPMDTEHKRQLVYSFTNLLSIARLQVKNKAAPFLQVRFQLWQRELRRLVGSVASTPVLKFSDDLKPAELEQHLPVIHCRECGAMGWGGSKQKQDQGVDPDLQQFYIHFFNHDTATVFLFPRETDQHGEWLCGHCLNISTSRNIKSCPFCASSDRLVPVTLSIITRQKDDKIHHTHNCPFCGGAESLTIIGLRASGMISVSIGQLFSSGFNDDKKLLAFSDSVQDASHKAGFFSARTFRFNFRSAVQQYLNKTGKPVVLSELPQQFINYYRRIWNDEKYIATFIAPNMTWFDDFSHLLLTGKAPAGLIPDINKRIGWEIFSEFGFNCRIGRTLEKTGSSIAVPDTARLQETVNLLLEPLQNEFGQLRNLTQSELILFLTGLLTQMKTRGAFEHPLLNAYKNSFGNAFLLNRVNILPDFGIYARTPVFLTIKRGTRFDTLLSGPSHGNTWYQNWVIKCFTHLDLSINSVMDDVLNKTVSALEKSGFLNQEIAGNFPIWSLAPSHFTVVTQVVQLRCDKCGHQHSIADHEKSDWDNAPCMRYNCSGTYSLQPTRNDYYRRLYALGSITRLYIEEHTGLLSRDEREELERRFMRDEAKNRKPWDPNALSCTPTLEMGINIGDLSSLILCSVPPDQSKYLQRIGRAGRRDGNSINVTVANGRAHDLYFYHEPETMMNGPVNPPGCFLNAPAVLERQLCAFSFDSWIREMQGQVVIPDKVKRVLSNFHKKDAQLFPNNWLAFVEQNKDRLIWEFIGLFPTGTKTETLEHLEQFLKGTSGEEGSLSYRIILELAELDREVNSYKDRIRKITQAIKQLQSNPAARDQNYDRVMAELEREKDALNGIINNILDRNVYNYMTDEGFLPNYTFPEAGVVLRSIIYRRRKLDSPTKYQTFTFEYERPAVSAIQELAPANRFYAQGRRVKIDQVDTRLSKFEEWIFCPNCPYMELAAISEDKKTCPLCGSINWSDAGQKRNMLRLRQVFATTSDRNSRSHDESDEREPEFYHKHMMVHAEHKDVKRAFIIDSDQVPFGFEFLTRAQFREINFGNKKTLSEEIEIAGQKFPRKGFELCKECGRVKNNKDIDHHLSCSFRNKPDDKSVVQSSYLYREFSSEALRILMPVTSFDTSDTKLHSFIAAFILGLKVKFRGNIDHLRTTTLDEPDPASQIRKKYLVLYDTVPGGTGYLKEL